MFQVCMCQRLIRTGLRLVHVATRQLCENTRAKARRSDPTNDLLHRGAHSRRGQSCAPIHNLVARRLAGLRIDARSERPQPDLGWSPLLPRLIMSKRSFASRTISPTEMLQHRSIEVAFSSSLCTLADAAICVREAGRVDTCEHPRVSRGLSSAKQLAERAS